MGYPMASNLLNNIKPTKFSIYDTSSQIIHKFLSEHSNHSIEQCVSPEQVASQSTSLITMLPASKNVDQAYFGKNGIFSSVKPGTTLIDSSTIDPTTSKRVAERGNALGCVVLDAPVSGGTGGAKAGSLTFMVGTDSQKTFDDCKDLLKGMGKNIIYCGINGNGQVAKIVNNMLLGISMIAASEAMNLGVRLGMDPKLLADILNSSSGRCWSTDTYNPCPGVMPNVPSSNNYKGGFGNNLMAKDLGLAVSASIESKSTVTLGAVAHQLYQQLSTTPGFENKDFSSVFKWLNDNSTKY